SNDLTDAASERKTVLLTEGVFVTSLRAKSFNLIVQENVKPLEIVGHGAVKSATLSELRGAYSNTAAVAQFIDFIEEINDVESYNDGFFVRDLDAPLQAGIERFIRMILFGIGEASP